jgi:predicted nucleic acid-binding protein
MAAERFSLDTNILVYAADRDAGGKRDRALEIIARASRRPCILTIQTLAEFYHATTRKGIVPQAEAAAQVRDWLELFPTAAADADALRLAMQASERGQLAFWDALVLATARQAGCAVVLSEDMADATKLNEVTVLDPFKGPDLPTAVAALLGLDA